MPWLYYKSIVAMVTIYVNKVQDNERLLGKTMSNGFSQHSSDGDRKGYWRKQNSHKNITFTWNLLIERCKYFTATVT